MILLPQGEKSRKEKVQKNDWQKKPVMEIEEKSSQREKRESVQAL